MAHLRNSAKFPQHRRGAIGLTLRLSAESKFMSQMDGLRSLPPMFDGKIRLLGGAIGSAVR